MSQKSAAVVQWKRWTRAVVVVLALLVMLVFVSMRDFNQGVVLKPDADTPAPGNRLDVSRADLTAFTGRTGIAEDEIESIFRWTEQDLRTLRNLSATSSLTMELGDRRITAERIQDPSTWGRTLVWKGKNGEDGRLISIAVVQDDETRDVLAVEIAVSGGLYVQQLPGTAGTYVVFHDRLADSTASKPPSTHAPASSSDAMAIGAMAGLPLANCETQGDAPERADVSISLGILYSPFLTDGPELEAKLNSAIEYLAEFSVNLQRRHGTKITWNKPQRLAQQDMLASAESRLWEKGELDNDQNEVLKAIREASKSHDLVLYITARPATPAGTLNLFGLAQSVPATGDKFIAIVSENSLSSRTILAHELSHLLGAEHEAPLELANESNRGSDARRSFAFERFYPPPEKTNAIRAWLEDKLNLLRGKPTLPAAPSREGTVGADGVKYRVAYLSDYSLYCNNTTLGWSSKYANQARILPTGFEALARLAETRYAQVPLPPEESDSESVTGTGTGSSSDPQKSATYNPAGAVGYCQSVSFPQRNCSDDDQAIVTLQFDRDAWSLTNQQKAELAKAMTGRLHGNATYLVTGHASSTGRLGNNYVLSKNRAVSVSAYLAQLASLNSQQIGLRVCATGPDLRLCSSHSEHDAVNQRVTIKLLNEN